MTKSEFTGKHVLIIEDNKDSLLLLEEYLSETGIKITSVESGEEAIEYVSNNLEIDIIITDIMLPGISGIEIIKTIKKIKKIPIIVQSAYAYEADINACKKAGADFFIKKPVRAEELINTINQILNKK